MPFSVRNPPFIIIILPLAGSIVGRLFGKMIGAPEDAMLEAIGLVGGTVLAGVIYHRTKRVS